MKQILLATTNTGKKAEFQAWFGDKMETLSTKDPAFSQITPPDVVEDGSTYYENALKKAIAYQKTFQCPVLSDDSGFEVALLGGAPGVDSANYGGKELGWDRRLAKLLFSLSGASDPDRTARFVCVLCFYDGKSVPRFFRAEATGRVVQETSGKSGFGYDPVFWSDDLKKTFAEATLEEKNRISHRGLAAQEFCRWYTSS